MSSFLEQRLAVRGGIFSMTYSRTRLASAAVIALLFGLEFPDPKLSGEHLPLPFDHTMVAAADKALDDGQRQTPLVLNGRSLLLNDEVRDR